jgi:TonB family protein
MIETVTDIVVARSREPEGLKTMVVCSLAGHIGLAVIAVLLGGPRAAEAPRTIMTISLSGAPGPKTGGQTQIGGQAVQAPPPQPQPVKPVEAPPAPKAPSMTLPDPRRPRPQPKVTQAPPDATAKTVNTGDVPTDGSTRVNTRVRGQGFGLSSAGNNSNSASAVTLDVSDFCCNEYIDQMVVTIRRNWDQNQGIVGSTTMQFTILKNGAIQAPQVEKSSGFVALDNAALRALQLSRLPPLPAAFENPTLTVHLRFDFQR